MFSFNLKIENLQEVLPISWIYLGRQENALRRALTLSTLRHSSVAVWGGTQSALSTTECWPIWARTCIAKIIVIILRLSILGKA
jgi:hypothetical protein